jgi:3',5'-cyclic AMP phosphodiesterase CpdA
MRVLHFSDIHILGPWRSVPIRDWIGKRLAGGVNLLLGRRRHFADAPRKVAALDRFRQELGVDLVISTGDYTALGTNRELAAAREVVQPLMAAPLGFVNVPGNHDLYVLSVIREGRFLRHFGDTLETDLPEYRVDDQPWPLVRLVGEDVAVVAVNSARPNPQPWRSSGKIPPAQLEALGSVLSDPRVTDRFVFVITHYAPRLADGRPDRRLHGLVNADEFLEVCSRLPRGAILCGHVHWRYEVRVPDMRPPIFCAGSATKNDVEGLWLFDVEPGRVRATPGRWIDDGYVLEQRSAVDV